MDSTMVIGRIAGGEGGKNLHLYPAKSVVPGSYILPGYYVIADKEKVGNLMVGDTVEYFACGTNFGLFVSKCSPSKDQGKS